MKEEAEAIQVLAQDDLPPLDFALEPVYSLLPAPIKEAGWRAITFRRLDWAPVPADRKWILARP